MSTRFYEFGPFQIDKLNHVLLRDGETLPLKPKVFDTLLLLVENRGRVLDKDELLSRLWPDTVVEESNLSQNVYLLRKVLGEEPRGETYIETMPKRGYRFVASVSEVEGAGITPEQPSALRSGIEKDETSVAPKYPAEAEQPTEEKELAASRWDKQASSWKMGALALAGLLLVFGIAWTVSNLWTTSKSRSLDSHAPIKSIAVLPFKSLNTDPGDDYLGLGMADTLITRLSSMNQFIVRETSAVRKFTSPNQDPVAAGRELKVDAVLEASLQRAGDRLRVTLRLVKVSDGSSLWSAKVDEQADDLLAVQDRVSEHVARALVPQITGEEQKLLAKRYTQNSEAYRLYILGRYHRNKLDVEGWKKAIEYFNQAIEKDPNYALAFAGLADCYLSGVADALLPKGEAIPKAKQAAMTALRLDDTLSEAHVSSARIKAYYDWDWAGAESELKRAIVLDPNSASAHGEYGGYLAAVGRSEEAVTEAKQSRELDPLSPLANFYFVWALISARRYDEAIEQSRQLLETFPAAHYWMGLAYVGKGKYEEATAEFEKNLSLSKDDTLTTRANLGYAYAASGKRAEAEKILAQIKELSRQQHASPYFVAIILAGLGEKDQAFASLEEAYTQHSRPIWGLKVNPVWNNLRSDPRFASLLQRVGLPQ